MQTKGSPETGEGHEMHKMAEGHDMEEHGKEKPGREEHGAHPMAAQEKGPEEDPEEPGAVVWLHARADRANSEQIHDPGDHRSDEAIEETGHRTSPATGRRQTTRQPSPGFTEIISNLISRIQSSSSSR